MGLRDRGTRSGHDPPPLESSPEDWCGRGEKNASIANILEPIFEYIGANCKYIGANFQTYWCQFFSQSVLILGRAHRKVHITLHSSVKAFKSKNDFIGYWNILKTKRFWC